MKHILLQLTVVITIAALAAGITWAIKDPNDKAKLDATFHCDPKTLKADEICFEQISGKVLWVDARSRGEWEKSAYPEAILWNLDPKENQQTFEAESALKILESERVVIYCSSEACGTSRQVAARIKSLELGPEVKILFGGYKALKAAGLDLSKATR